jgi:predicted dehydrogenase
MPLTVWGKAAHVPAIAAAAGVTLHAVASRSQSAADDAAQAFGATLAFADPEELARSPDVDLVAVAVRAPGHRDIVLAALRAGKPVYCEWPLGVNLSEAVEMSAAAQGIPTAIGLQGRHSPWLIYLRELIEKGAIGRVVAANLIADDDLPYEAWSSSNVYMLKAENGANALAIHAGHFLDYLAFAVGEFAFVSGIAAMTRASVTIKETGEIAALSAPDQIALAMHTEGGAVVGAQIIGGRTPGDGMTLVVRGTEGTLRATSPGYMHWRTVNIAIAKKGSDTYVPMPTPDRLFSLRRMDTPGPEYILAYAYSAFAQAITNKTPFSPDFSHAVVRHRMIEAVKVQA